MKACDARQPALILARDFAQAEALDELLWSFDADAFVPHQIAGDDDDAEAAVLIAPPGVDTPARPLLINLREECPALAGERVLEVVAADPAERDGSRLRWREYQRRGFQVVKYDM